MTPSRAAFVAWRAFLRKSTATPALAAALVEGFDDVEEPDREGWQAFVNAYGKTSGYEPLAAAAVERFDLVPKTRTKT